MSKGNTIQHMGRILGRTRIAIAAASKLRFTANSGEKLTLTELRGSVSFSRTITMKSLFAATTNADKSMI